jgi:hypothetical protein
MFVLANPFWMFFKIIKTFFNVIDIHLMPNLFFKVNMVVFQLLFTYDEFICYLEWFETTHASRVCKAWLVSTKGFTQVVFKCDNLQVDMKAMPIKHKQMMIGWKYISIQRFRKMKHPLSKKLTNCHLGLWLHCHSFSFLTPFDVIPCSPFPFKYVKMRDVGTYNINTCQYWQSHLANDVINITCDPCFAITLAPPCTLLVLHFHHNYKCERVDNDVYHKVLSTCCKNWCNHY